MMESCFHACIACRHFHFSCIFYKKKQFPWQHQGLLRKKKKLQRAYIWIHREPRGEERLFLGSLFMCLWSLGKRKTVCKRAWSRFSTRLSYKQNTSHYVKFISTPGRLLFSARRFFHIYKILKLLSREKKQFGLIITRRLGKADEPERLILLYTKHRQGWICASSCAKSFSLHPFVK